MVHSPLASKKYYVNNNKTRGERHDKDIKWLVVHSAICCDAAPGSAHSLAKYLSDGALNKGKPRKVSWHLNIDGSPLDEGIVASLDERWIGIHTGSKIVDTHSLGCEMCAQVPGDWNHPDYLQMLDNTSYAFAEWCRRYNIPPEPLTAAQLRAGQPGIISHNLSRLVYGGTSHTDPGVSFPWAKFWDLTVKYFNPTAIKPDPEITVHPKLKTLSLDNIIYQHTDFDALITALYRYYLERLPDKDGLTYWVQALDAGATLWSVKELIRNSPEAKQLLQSKLN
jgi:hypothetical protein